MDRTTLLRGMIDTSGRGLEIGPSYNPLLPKAAGFLVETVDYLDAEGLRAKYADNPNANINSIETVDHVLDGTSSLAEAIGRPGAFDFIVASHVIEHVPDMLGFLHSCETLLSPAGILLLAVPDKRHCFDVLQPLSTTGAILQAHREGHTKPTPGAVFDDRAYNAVRMGAIGWAAGDTRELAFFANLDEAVSSYTQAAENGAYIDVHVWRFVPSSFRLIVNDLNAIGRCALKEAAFHSSVGNEFYVALSRSGAGCPLGRLQLALLALSEHASVSA